MSYRGEIEVSTFDDASDLIQLGQSVTTDIFALTFPEEVGDLQYADSDDLIENPSGSYAFG